MAQKDETDFAVDIEALLLADRAGALDLPLFDARYYNHQLPQFAQKPNGAFEHFITNGERLGLSPHPLYDRRYVLEQATAAGIEVDEDFSLFLYALSHDISTCRLFSVSYYRAALAKAGGEVPAGKTALAEFLTNWGAYRADFSPYFDVNFYQLNNPHLRLSRANPLEHYFRVPQHERSDANPMFHAGYYFNTYKPEGVDPLVDFLDRGCGQLNLPNPYAAQELLSEAFLTAENLLHYIESRST